MGSRQMTSLLALDISMSCGHAYFSSPMAAPRCGTWPSEVIWNSDNYGAYYVAFEDWLLGMLNVMQPETLAFESPIVGGWGSGRGNDQNNMRRLIGVCAVVELLAKRRRLPCYEVDNQVAKSFMGVPGRRPKDMSKGQYKNLMVAAITTRGFDVADDHQADAAAVGLVVMVDLGLITE